MIKKIKDYFLTVLARMIVGYIIFTVIAVVTFLAYAIVVDFKSSVDFIVTMLNSVMGKVFLWLPFILAWFRDDIKGSKPTDHMSFASKQLLGFYKSNKGIESEKNIFIFYDTS